MSLIKHILRQVKAYFPMLILSLTLFIGELHTFWETPNPEPPKQNWIWKKPTPMTLQWNIKQASSQLNYILYFIAFYLYGKTPKRKLNVTAVKAFIFFMIVDAIMYFWNYKTYYYGATYMWVIGCGVIVHFWNGKYAERLWNIVKQFGR